MAKRGLGRGLDALIPDKSSGKSSKSAKKASGQNEKAAKKETKSASKPAAPAKKATAKTTPAKKSSAVKAEPVKEVKTEPVVTAPVEPKADGSEVISMKISQVEPNRGQPRKYFDDDAIGELADSIRQFGIIQPLLVQEKDGYFEIIAGERRWRAAKKAGLKEIPVIVRKFSNQEAVEIALIENIQREDLNPIEEAKAYEQLVRDYGLSQEDVAARVSKSRSAVTNSMRLLKLEAGVQKLVETGQLTEGHARAILGLSDPELQKQLADKVIKEHLSVRQTEKLVRDGGKPKAPEKKKINDSDTALYQFLAENMKTVLGTKVSIKPTGRDKGRIEIEYYSGEDLDRLYEQLIAVQTQ